MRRLAIPLLAAAVLAACGETAVATSSDPRTPITTAATAHRRLLDGDGIGSVRFGQSPVVVAARLSRLFGPPVGARQIAHGYIRVGCGFYWEVWNGVGASSDGHVFVAQLSAWFRHSHLVGYTYFLNNVQTGVSTWNRFADRPMVLATARGLAVGDPLGRARRLYGRALVVTTQMQGTPPDPRLPRLPVWEASTPSGRIAGGIGVTILVKRAHGSSRWTLRRRSITAIGAGAAPNTPCGGGVHRRA